MTPQKKIDRVKELLSDLPDYSKTFSTPLFTRARYGDEMSAVATQILRGTNPNWVGAFDGAVKDRTPIFDRELRKFLVIFPDATILNLGCGLCTRFWRVDNARIKWIDIDHPKFGEIRSLIFGNLDRVSFIGQNFNEDQNLPDHDFLIAEGCFPYLEERHVRVMVKRPALFDVRAGPVTKVRRWGYSEGQPLWDLKVLDQWKYGPKKRGSIIFRTEP